MNRPTYRVGNHLGRTVYQVTEGGEYMLIGVMDTPQLGQLVVDALLAHEDHLCEVAGCLLVAQMGVLCAEHMEHPVRYRGLREEPNPGDAALQAPHRASGES